MNFNRPISALCLVAGIVLLSVSCGKRKSVYNPEDRQEPAYSAADTQSYALGFMIAREAEKNQVKIDVPTMMKGLEDGMKGMNGIHPDTLLRYYGTTLRKTFSDGYFKRVFFIAEENLKKTEKRLTDIKLREGVALLPSGVLYKVIRTGTGPLPPKNAKVSARYRVENGKGQVIRDSWADGAPEVLDLNGMIPGIQSALLAMHEGSEWEIWLPPAQAYGDEGIPGTVEPNDLIHARIDFLSVVKEEIPAASDTSHPSLANPAQRDTHRVPNPVVRPDTARRAAPARADTARVR